jgi:hypothetical protein
MTHPGNAGPAARSRPTDSTRQRRGGGLALAAVAAALLLAPGVAPAGTAEAAEGQPCTHPYLAPRAGGEWHYRAGMPGLPILASEDVVRYTDVTPTSFVQVREVGGDAGRIVQRWSCGANGLSQTAGPLEVIPTDAGVTGTGRMSDVAGVTLPPPDRWQAGYTWKESFGAKFSGLDVIPGTQPRSEGALERTHTIAGQEAVTVPAGTYNAWRVDTTATGQVTVTLGGQPETLDVTSGRTAWYVEGVGLVKSVDTLDDMVIDQMELLSAAP